jgi:nitroimidazol reductase NimA-like FMN-containing flavoprotein (pyridoxamine 5'-phosphate oxidase superfamily)
MAELPTMRRQDKLITDRAAQLRILDDAKVVRVGLIDGDRPYVVPMNFGRDGDDLWLHAAGAGGLKLECIRRHPQVCVEADHFVRLVTGESACGHWTSHYLSVIGFGTAEIVEDAALKVHGLTAIMRKYSGRPDWEFEDAQVAKTAVIRIRLESLTGKQSPAQA